MVRKSMVLLVIFLSFFVISCQGEEPSLSMDYAPKVFSLLQTQASGITYDSVEWICFTFERSADYVPQSQSDGANVLDGCLYFFTVTSITNQTTLYFYGVVLSFINTEEYREYVEPLEDFAALEAQKAQFMDEMTSAETRYPITKNVYEQGTLSSKQIDTILKSFYVKK
ncbi:MAG: hypothetical protein U1C51_04190 [Candidatus Izemoplasmatales bacterium]|nr:hypothetical protein [Candidatus Izemoplasmatales bacterium]